MRLLLRGLLNRRLGVMAVMVVMMMGFCESRRRDEQHDCKQQHLFHTSKGNKKARL